MKKLLSLAFLLPNFALAATVVDSTRTFHYEVTTPGVATPRRVDVHEGENAEVELLGKLRVYPKSAASMSKQEWDDRERMGNLPVHDSVRCGGDICWYTTDTQLQEKESLVLTASTENLVHHTRLAYSNVAAKKEKSFKVTPTIQWELPESEDDKVTMNFFITEGETVDLPVKDDAHLRVKLVSID